MPTRFTNGTFSANGSSAELPINHHGLVMMGPTGGGTDFGGGVVSLEVRGADGQWYPSGIQVSTPDVRRVQLDIPKFVRLTLAGATVPDLDYVVESDRVE